MANGRAFHFNLFGKAVGLGEVVARCGGGSLVAGNVGNDLPLTPRHCGSEAHATRQLTQPIRSLAGRSIQQKIAMRKQAEEALAVRA
jgi:hypothetical protein